MNPLLVDELATVQDTTWPGIAEQVRQYLDTAGRLPEHPTGAPLMLLTTRGKRSGILRRTMLLHGRDGGDPVLVGSAGGRDRHPSWYLNMLADPHVIVQKDDRAYRALAATVDNDDRERLWAAMLEIFPHYTQLQTRTTRRFPIVRIVEQESRITRERVSASGPRPGPPEG